MVMDLVDIFEANRRDFCYANRRSDETRLREFDCPNCGHVFEIYSTSVTRCPECGYFIDNDGNIIN